ncbi:MAG: hypothetical protein ACQSGP_10210 [Frankia sp.]
MGQPVWRSGELRQPDHPDHLGPGGDGVPGSDSGPRSDLGPGPDRDPAGGDGRGDALHALHGGGRWRPPLDLSAGRGDLGAGLVCLVAMIIAGPLLGLLWAATAPHLDVGAVLAGSEAAFDAQGGADIYFGLICLVGGAVGGGLALWRARDASWPVPLGLAVGGFGGSLLAGAVGHAVRTGGIRHQLPAGAGPYVISLVDFRLRAHGFYVVMPATALVVLAIGLWLTTHAQPREAEPAPPD